MAPTVIGLNFEPVVGSVCLVFKPFTDHPSALATR